MSELDDDARRIAELVIGDARASRFLVGNDVETLLADAHRFAATLAVNAARRRPIVDYDGGARVTAAAPRDPVKGHDKIAVEVLRRSKLGGPLDDPLD